MYLTGITILMACQNNSKHSDTGQIRSESRQENTPDNKQEKHGAAGITVQLNEGKKWVANPETTEGIHQMTALLDSFNGRATAGELRTLKEDLDKAFNRILQRCTMTGEAHAQLHNYLLPMKKMIQELNPDSADQTETLSRLKAYLSEYQNYFSS